MKSKIEIFYLVGTTRSGVGIKISGNLQQKDLEKLRIEWEKNQDDVIDVYSLAEYLCIWFLRYPLENLEYVVQAISNMLHHKIQSPSFQSKLLAINLRVSADFVRLGETLAEEQFRA